MSLRSSVQACIAMGLWLLPPACHACVLGHCELPGGFLAILTNLVKWADLVLKPAWDLLLR